MRFQSHNQYRNLDPSVDTDEKFDPEQFIINLASLQKGIREGKFRPTFVDPLELPIIAAIIKENIDRKRAIKCLWQVKLKMDQFLKIYLTLDKYEAYFKATGKIPYKEVAPISFDRKFD